MNELFYKMIYKRKSFHVFKEKYKLSVHELNEIKEFMKSVKSLDKEIKFDYKIVTKEETSCKRGEYCILFYSEIKNNYLQNIGYIGEQIDLWLAFKNIGVCWYGMGKTEEVSYNGLDFIIMLSIEKVDESEFRKDMFKSKRKQVEEIWCGDSYLNIANVVRFAPSSCNTQPWQVESNSKEFKIFRYKQPGKRGVMPVNRVNFFNKIDIGIFLLFIEICLQQEYINYVKVVYLDSNSKDQEKTLIAKYTLLNNNL